MTQADREKTIPTDIVQVDPEHDERFGGCLMVVTEVKEWGVQGYVHVPAGGDAFYRAPWAAIELCGRAKWIRREESDE